MLIHKTLPLCTSNKVNNYFSDLLEKKVSDFGKFLWNIISNPTTVRF